MTQNQSASSSSPNTTELFLKSLRMMTAPMHEALESNRFSRSITSDAVSLKDYIIYLQLFYGFMHPLEQQVYPYVAQVIPDAAKRSRAALIVEDLKHLGMSAQEISELPLCKLLPDTSDIATRLGAMYVLEGSTLGGQVISRHLHKALSLQGQGVSFFSGHGKETGPMWKDFLSRFCQAVTDTGTEGSTIRAAQDTFSYFHAWLEGAGAMCNA